MKDPDLAKQRPLHISIATILIMMVASAFIHEIGHAVALNLIGIPATFAFDIRNASPVFMTKWLYPPSTTLELAFVIIVGPGVAAIICAILGRFWRAECYVWAVFHAFYVPFELLTWAFGIQSCDSLLIFLPFLVIVFVPTIIITHKIFNWMERKRR